MSKIWHEYVFDMQPFKKSEVGWVEKQHLQLKIKECCMLCLMEKTTHFIEKMSYEALSENLNKISKMRFRFGSPAIKMWAFLLHPKFWCFQKHAFLHILT